MTVMLSLRECEIVYRRRKINAPSRTVRSSADVAAILRSMGAHERVCESMWALQLCARKGVLAFHEVARGGVASVPVELSALFRAAILIGANAVILAHNHPSGEATPSADDLNFTARAVTAGQLLGIPVLDHVILGADTSYSMLDAGDMRSM